MLIKLRGFQKSPQESNAETVTNENDKEIPKERCMSPEKRQKIVNYIKLK